MGWVGNSLDERLISTIFETAVVDDREIHREESDEDE